MTRDYKKWTPSEIEYIKEKYPTVETKVIASRLGVTEWQIRGVVNRENLKKRAPRSSSTNSEKHPYCRGYSWWSENAFWRDPSRRFSEKAKRMYESWLEDMRASERSLTRLQ